MRLDARLVAAGKVTSRSRAADLIKRGLVTLDGKRLKASDKVTTTDFDRLDISDHRWVSRAALKLVEALRQCPDFDPRGHACIDIGASTGGFTEVLLDAGATHVLALDVGHDQLHPRLRKNTHISNLEGFNARDLAPELLTEHGITRLVSDVSFISVTKALEPALRALPVGAQALILIKPQFEVGRDGLQKDGVAKDPASALQLVQDWLSEQHPDWAIVWQGDSPIHGGDGNREFLMYVVR
ncbi:MAG: TlyA family RNA methyltransferase [Alphaproteobacteria bacterium]|nr:TlyA family RNA methyltransferase [Alphaproteobacteria bacterium]